MDCGWDTGFRRDPIVVGSQTTQGSKATIMKPTTRKTMLLLVCLLTVVSQIAAQDRHPLADVGQASYEFMLSNQTVGHEEVTFRADGWSVEGRYRWGRNRHEYSVHWVRTTADAGEWRVSGTRGAIRGEWRDDSIAVYVGDAKLATANVDWSGESVPLFYENLLWTVYSEMAVRLFAADKPAAGKMLTFYQPRTRSKIAATVQSIATRQWHRRATEPPVELRDLVFQFGDLEIHASFTVAGLLVHLTVPSQHIQVVCRGYEGAAPAGKTMVHFGPWRGLLSTPTHEFTKKNGLRATTRDGVELVADAFVPNGDGPWPTVLMRTPYGRANPGRSQGAFWASRGYAFVAQDVRGCFDSNVHEIRFKKR